MSDASFWTLPPDLEVNGWGEYAITIIEPPFPTSIESATLDTVKQLAPHDPVRAHQVAKLLGTVDAVLEELLLTDTVSESVWTRADLDIIKVGCWGNVIGISDPALADNGNTCPLLEETDALHRLFPEARIVGSVGTDMGADHHEYTIHFPEGRLLHAEGWSNTNLDGDPHKVLRALGVAPGDLVGTDAELDEENLAETNWNAVTQLILGPWAPWHFSHVQMSAFRVRHTEHYTNLMEEIWRFDD
ncbi:DUF6333 family protein [Streptomyces acidicola]|uniref:DUF6333 family protein n=1 Tax=Streptomyces acidicola TaxID=2596892 RepID=UPI0034333344